MIWLPHASSGSLRLPQASSGFLKLLQASSSFLRLPHASHHWDKTPHQSKVILLEQVSRQEQSLPTRPKTSHWSKSPHLTKDAPLKNVFPAEQYLPRASQNMDHFGHPEMNHNGFKVFSTWSDTIKSRKPGSQEISCLYYFHATAILRNI